ncbi:hypothetical protein VZG28_14525 (plasmid) [Synechococcus elongatus IITB4]|uniref:Uncharacterized protein n=1 Tax=Synechococcus elongatus PCC 11801 TaxID=2219813 RepID=A0ACD5A306_SYNEL
MATDISSVSYRGFDIAYRGRCFVDIRVGGRLVTTIPVASEASASEALRLAQQHLDRILKVA